MTLLCCLQWTECLTEGARPASPSAKVRYWAVSSDSAWLPPLLASPPLAASAASSSFAALYLCLAAGNGGFAAPQPRVVLKKRAHSPPCLRNVFLNEGDKGGAADQLPRAPPPASRYRCSAQRHCLCPCCMLYCQLAAAVHCCSINMLATEVRQPGPAVSQVVIFDV